MEKEKERKKRKKDNNNLVYMRTRGRIHCDRPVIKNHIYPTIFEYGTKKAVVFILDGCSFHYVHTRSK